MLVAKDVETATRCNPIQPRGLLPPGTIGVAPILTRRIASRHCAKHGRIYPPAPVVPTRHGRHECDCGWVQQATAIIFCMVVVPYHTNMPSRNNSFCFIINTSTSSSIYQFQGHKPAVTRVNDSEPPGIGSLVQVVLFFGGQEGQSAIAQKALHIGIGQVMDGSLGKRDG